MPQSGWIKRSEYDPSVIDAFLYGEAYEPHRHDTYTFALTVAGEQCFNYRGSLKRSLPGQLVVLHPDELHDGQAGTEAGFRYQAVFVAPETIQSAIGRAPLPFLPSGVTSDAVLVRSVRDILLQLDTPIDPFEHQDALEQMALRLAELEGSTPKTLGPIDIKATNRASTYILDNRLDPISIDDIAAAAEMDRWSLSRSFKARFGTSPYRYLTLRRLDKAMELMAQGEPLS